MHDHNDNASVAKEENIVRDLLRNNMDAACERLRADADNFPGFNQMAKDLYYEKTPPGGATVVLEPIFHGRRPSNEKYVEVWNQHVLDGKSRTVTVGVIGENGSHRSVGR